MCRLYQLFVKAVPVVGLPFGKSLALNFHTIALFLPHAQNINIKCWCWCFLIDWHLNCDEFAHHKIPPYHNVRHFCHNGRQFLGRNTFYPPTIFHQEKLSTKEILALCRNRIADPTHLMGFRLQNENIGRKNWCFHERTKITPRMAKCAILT